MVEFMTQIPARIKNKVEDKDWSQDFIFESMPCSHQPDDKEHLKVDCTKCKFDEREIWLENHLKTVPLDETTKKKDGSNATLSKIKVIRGKYDDCIGIMKEFT